MGITISRRHSAKVTLLLFVVVLFLSIVDITYAVTQTQIAAGLNAAVGAAIDETKNQLYFVEYNPAGNGSLKRIDLPPQCGTPTTPACSSTITTVANGFSHPEDVQLDLEHGLAYVTTRDDPGTTGALWKVVISAGTKSMVTFNLGAPQQLVLDVPNNNAYTVGYNDGRLRRIDLTTGAKTPLFKGLGHPVGLAVTKARNYAFVTEQDTGRLARIDLTTGVMVEALATGFTAPFFLAWTDSSQNSLYVVERDPANKVSRVDLTTKAKNDAITALPWRPSSIAVSSSATPVYIATDNEIVKVDMVTLTGPVFMGVGHVPYSSIINGYATTDPGYFYQVKHSPFGGRLNIFGNLSNFKSLGATHYQIEVSKDGGAFVPLSLSWNMYKWNTTTLKYDLVPVAPDHGTTKYTIPLEADSNYHPEFWYPPFLFMQWPSGENGFYTFMVKIYQKSGMIWNDLTGSLPAALNSLTLRIDNTPQDVKLMNICQKGTPGGLTDPCYPDKEIKPCDIVSTGNNQYYFKITAYDANHHLLNYSLNALWGDNKSEGIYSDAYNNHVDAEGPYRWSGVSNFIVPRDVPGSAGNPATWNGKCNCAHTFYLGSWKRTINGYNYILYQDYHKSVTINNTGVTCGIGPCGFSCP
jgi:DNA-binding beta-propeller fold protein YncE